MIKLVKVSKDYGSFRAVQDVSLTVQPGEIFGLLGENGAGKTTVLRMISTVLSPTSGEVFVGIHSTRDHSLDVRRMIGVVVGEAVYDRLTVEENLAYFGRLHGMDPLKIRSAIPDLLERLQLGNFRTKLSGQLSKGNKQKLSIGRALLHDPPVIIMDEPMTGLDVGAQQAVRNLITDLKKRGKTVLFSSHNMRDIDRLCDRIALIAKGRLVACGAVEHLLRDSQATTLEDMVLSLQGVESNAG